jgi:hypothetical protein
VARSTTGPVARPGPVGAGTTQELWAGLLIIGVTLAALYPVASADFVAWDDYTTVAKPPAQTPRLSRLRDYWTRPQGDLYIPVTYTVWAVVGELAEVPSADASGVKLNPYVFHLVSLGLHLVSTLLVWRILRILVADAMPAAVGAVVFGVHPVQVEVVGWVSGMKDVLSGMWSMVALWGYLKSARIRAAAVPRPERGAERSGGRAYYAAATAALLLALLSKPAAVSVPIIAAALDRCALGRRWREVATDVAPWLVLAIPVVLVARACQPASFIAAPLWARPVIAADALAFYLYKLVWPAKLGIVYGRTPAAVLERGWAYWTWAVPAAVAAAVYAARNRARLLAVAAGVFVAGLLPVLGFARFDFQLYSTVADHYLYLAMLGVALAVSAAAAAVTHSIPPGRARTAALLTGAAVLAALAVRSWYQTWHWHDSLSLFENAVRVDPDSPAMRTLLAAQLNSLGRYGEAYDQAMRVAKAEPRYGGAYVQAGRALWGMGRRETAVEAYRAAVECRPDYAPSHLALGQALLDLGRTTEADAEFNEARRLSSGK